MRHQPIKILRHISSLGLVLLLSACSGEPIYIKDYLRPIRKLLNRERTYWTDKIEYVGESGSEIVYYKNGRPALERLFDEAGLLRTVSYFDRQGDPIRKDSLIYAQTELIGGYYFAEPGHQLILHFINYKQQDQLSQRSWFDGDLQLLSREFFLFDRLGQRRMRMIFDDHDVLLFSETFQSGTDVLELQNTYNVRGQLVYQVRYEESKDPVRYEFESSGRIISITQLRQDGTAAWTNHLLYNDAGAVIQSNFTTESRFLVSYMGDLEFFQQQVRTWRHPAQPTEKLQLIKFDHQEPFVSEEVSPKGEIRRIEYRFPKSRALFKRSLLEADGRPLSDTLYGGGPQRFPLAVMDYDENGQISRELTYDLQGQPKWRRVWFRDDQKRTIREEVTALPDSFAAAVTRFYDCLGKPAFSERFSDRGVFEGTWVNYHGGGIKKTLFYNDQTQLAESWLFRPAGDTVLHSKYDHIDYFTVESRLGPNDTLYTQRRYTSNGLLDWELFFDGQGQLLGETQRKKGGDLYREVVYDPAERSIKTTTYAPRDPDMVSIHPSQRTEISTLTQTRLNASGKTIQLISRTSSGEIAWEKRYAYRDGKLLKAAQLDAHGKPIIISTFTHDEAGNILTEKAVDSKGAQVHLVENRYDADQRLIWSSFTGNVAGNQSSNRYYYDTEGRIQRNEMIENSRFLEAIEYAYYPQLYLRVGTHYDPDGILLFKEIENYFRDGVFAASAQQKE